MPALGEHGSSRGGSLSQRGSRGETPRPAPASHPVRQGDRSGDTRLRLPSAAAGSSGARRDSVTPPRGHPPTAVSFVAVVPRRAEGGRERRTGRAWDGHQRSFAGASTGGRCPQRPGAAGRDPTGRRGQPTAAPQRERIIPFTNLQVVDAIVRPETPSGGDSSLHFCTLSKGENPA